MSAIRPQTVEVVGPASAIERLTEALTEPVSVAGAQHDVTDSVTVGLTHVFDPSLTTETLFASGAFKRSVTRKSE